MEHVEAGLVGGEPRPLRLHPPERTNGHRAIRLPAPRASPVLQPQHLVRGFLDERFHRILVREPVGTRNGVVRMGIQAIASLDDRCRAAFRRDGVAAHRVDLGDHGNAEVGVRLGRGDGRS